MLTYFYIFNNWAKLLVLTAFRPSLLWLRRQISVKKSNKHPTATSSTNLSILALPKMKQSFAENEAFYS